MSVTLLVRSVAKKGEGEKVRKVRGDEGLPFFPLESAFNLKFSSWTLPVVLHICVAAISAPRMLSLCSDPDPHLLT